MSEAHCAIRPRGGHPVSVQACRIVAHSWLTDAGSSQRISSIVETLFDQRDRGTARDWAGECEAVGDSARHEWRNALRLLRPTR
jgi:hypothetical protein